MRKWLGQDYKPWSVPALCLGLSDCISSSDACVNISVVFQAEEEAEVEYTEEEEAIKTIHNICTVLSYPT